MSYTILSAKFANQEGTAAVIETAEAGAVMVSQADTPDVWAQLPADTQAYVEPVVIPAEVTMRQARLALNAIGKLASVDAVIASLPDPQKTDAQIEWQYSSAVERNKPLVLQLGPALGLSSADIDNLFITAAGL